MIIYLNRYIQIISINYHIADNLCQLVTFRNVLSCVGIMLKNAELVMALTMFVTTSFDNN